MIHYLWWIPLASLYYIGYAFLSTKANVSSSFNWPIILYLYGGIIQLWVIVSRISKNLVFDAFLYDFVLILSQTITLIILTNSKLSFAQILGVVLVVTGLILVRT